MSLPNTPDNDIRKPSVDNQNTPPPQQPVSDNGEMNISPSDLLGFIEPDLIKPKIQSGVNSRCFWTLSTKYMRPFLKLFSPQISRHRAPLSLRKTKILF